MSISLFYSSPMFEVIVLFIICHNQGNRINVIALIKYMQRLLIVRFMSSANEFTAIKFLLFARSISNFSSFISTFNTNSEPKFQLDSATELAASFTMGIFGEILYPLSDLNEIRHQGSSKTSK